jgi:hypothetical protein
MGVRNDISNKVMIILTPCASECIAVPAYGEFRTFYANAIGFLTEASNSKNG